MIKHSCFPRCEICGNENRDELTAPGVRFGRAICQTRFALECLGRVRSLLGR